VGSFAKARLRHVPQLGDNLLLAGWRFTVTEVNEPAVLRFKIERA
jgi:CBS domain containing-hemolysin-like protein